MKFNCKKFREATNNSSTYSEWDESLMQVLEEAGDALPTYNYREHIFAISIERSPTKNGRHRVPAVVQVVCPDKGQIQIKACKNLKAEEIPAAVEGVVKFLSVMENAGYISIREEGLT